MATASQENVRTFPSIAVGNGFADCTSGGTASSDRGILGTHPTLLTGYWLLAARNKFALVRHRHTQDCAHHEVVQVSKFGESFEQEMTRNDRNKWKCDDR